MATTNINIRMDENLKEEFSKFCNDVGMTMTTAVNVFAKRAVSERRIPFEISAFEPNQETLEAIAELDEMENNPNKYKRYNNAKEMFDDMGVVC